MDYEILKKLKEAGFPQDGNNCFSIQERRGELCDLPEKEHKETCDDWDCKNTIQPDLYEPTLEELMAACGDDLEEIENTFDGWRVYAYGLFEDDGTMKTFWAEDPKEVVAKLWLAVNTL